jgi:hypothetical protein
MGEKGFIFIYGESKPSQKWEMHGFVWEQKASFSYMERVNHPKNGDVWICMGEKGFIFMLERVNLPKNGDVWICMGAKGFIL